LNQFATLKRNLSTERRTAVGLLDWFRHFVLAADPGLVQLKQAAKTVLAVVIGLEAFRYFEGQVALYAGMSAGFLMQSTAGTARRTRQIAMAAMGLITTIFVGLGSELSARRWAKQVLLLQADAAGNCAAGWARSAGPMMAAVLTGLCSAFLVYFFVLPDESLRAFRHASHSRTELRCCFVDL